MAILLSGCATWMLTERIQKKFDGNRTRMLRGILKKSREQGQIKQQRYDQLPAISKTTQIRRTRHAGHCWRSKDKLLICRSSVLSIVHVLCYAWKWILTWASGSADYMRIRAFQHEQVVSSIPGVLIGYEHRSGNASVHIYRPTHWHLAESPRQPGRRTGPGRAGPGRAESLSRSVLFIFSCALGQ